MEAHPLNLAHQQHRRAEALLKNNRYDDAMQCHHNAAELLLDAMKSTSSSVALESITLQHSYHLKQKDLIKNKKEQYARVKKAMENIKLLGKEPLSHLHGNEQSKLQVQIYRAIYETDSLLNVLTKKDSSDNQLKQGHSNDIKEGKKTDKTQEVVVEELQILSQNLHSLVEQLVLQVEVLKDENMSLKERVSYLEKERVKYLNLPTASELFPRNVILAGMQHESFTEPVVPLVRPQNVERPPQQPFFDLSALKD